MTDQTWKPSDDIVANANVNAEQYEAMYAASIADPDAFWGEQGKRLDWIKPFTKVKNTSFDYHNVSIKWFEDGKLNVVGQLRRPASGEARRSRPRSSGKATIRASPSTSAIRNCTSRSAKFGQRPAGAGREEGRPRHPLHADDPAGGLRDARLRADRRDPFDRVRGLFGGRAGARVEGCGRQAGDHRRRGAARRAADAAEGQRRQGARRASTGVQAARRASAPAANRLGRGPRLTGCHEEMERVSDIASPTRWTPRTRCSSSTPPARPASRRAWCTPRAAISSMPR